MRAFVAVEVPEAARRELAALQERLKRAGVDAGWSRSAAMHLTLRFLGEIDAALAPPMLEALAAALAAHARFRIGIAGIGTFPGPRRARVVWAGIAGDLDRLAALQDAVERAAADLGLGREERPFTPHLTLGRIRAIRHPDRWLEALEELKDFRHPEFEVASVQLMESELKPSGPVHRELGRVGLRPMP